MKKNLPVTIKNIGKLCHLHRKQTEEHTKLEKYLTEEDWLDNPVLKSSENFTSHDCHREEEVGGEDGKGQADAQVVRHELLPERFVAQVLDDLPKI